MEWFRPCFDLHLVVRRVGFAALRPAPWTPDLLVRNTLLLLTTIMATFMTLAKVYEVLRTLRNGHPKDRSGALRNDFFPMILAVE